MLAFLQDFIDLKRKEANNLHGDISAIDAALPHPINLDALYEALARECERLEAKWLKDNQRFMTAAYFLAREAEAHRAKKEGK